MIKLKTSLHILFFLSLLSTVSSQTTCHLTCKSCSGPKYYQCLTCPQNRGNFQNLPIAGMCYCTSKTDQNNEGVCTDYQFNRNSKTIISVFISLALLISLIGSLISGQRHFLIKTLEDVQEISLIVLINIYFPQQLDTFLASLYKFNISSAAFSNLASGSLFIFYENDPIRSTDGQNIFGKYKLLQKTANFFSNQFTWLIVFIFISFLALLIRVIRNRLEKCEVEKMSTNKNVINKSGNAQRNRFIPLQQDVNIVARDVGVNTNRNKETKSNLFKIISKICNFVWLNLFIIFFYLSLIQINVNVFTQISNLTFSSGFAATGAFFSALFMALQFVVLSLLALKTREETIKPGWMRDYSYSTPIYMLRTNYKTATKYFWFGCCIKKILLAAIVTTLYTSPDSATLGICSVQAAFIFFTVYCEPYQRRYLRIHYYSVEGMKLFLYLCLLNFTEQQEEYVRMIQMTKTLYFMLAFIFGFNFFCILLSVVGEKDIYARAWVQRVCPNSQSSYVKGKLGYYCQGKIFIFEK